MTDATPARVTLTDDERESLAVAAFCAPDKEIMASLEAWLAARDATREAAVRAQIKADILALRPDAACGSPVSYRSALDLAARIAGGEQA